MPVRSPEGPTSVSLALYDFDGQLQINWDRTATAVQSASGANLEITDGGAKSLVPLDQRRLLSGAFTYARRTGRVDVHLRLEQAGGKPFDEFTTFLGAPPSKPATDPGEEARQLRDELKSQAARTRQLERALNTMREEMRKRQADRQEPEQPAEH